MNIDIDDILAELDRDTTVVDQSGINLGSESGNSTKYNSSLTVDGKTVDVAGIEGTVVQERRPMYSAASDFEELMKFWKNERCAPELLPYPQNLITRIMRRIQNQMEMIENISMGFLEDSMNENSRASGTVDEDEEGYPNPAQTQQNNKLPLLCMEAELERIKFVIRSLLRCRLSKIDKFSLYLRTIMDSAPEEYNLLMSTNERFYHEKHFNITLKLFTNSILKNLPLELQTIDDTEGSVSMIDEPQWKRFVFIYVNEVPLNNDSIIQESGLTKNEFGKYCYNVIIQDLDEEVELALGGIYVMAYDSIRDLLVNGQVQLI